MTQGENLVSNIYQLPIRGGGAGGVISFIKDVIKL
jgi:hypothetical protein